MFEAKLLGFKILASPLTTVPPPPVARLPNELITLDIVGFILPATSAALWLARE
jgi:hypothetical protein